MPSEWIRTTIALKRDEIDENILNFIKIIGIKRVLIRGTKNILDDINRRQNDNIKKETLQKVIKKLEQSYLFKRKVIAFGNSLAITIPSQITELHDIKPGDYMELEPIGYGEFKLKKVKERIYKKR